MNVLFHARQINYSCFYEISEICRPVRKLVAQFNISSDHLPCGTKRPVLFNIVPGGKFSEICNRLETLNRQVRVTLYTRPGSWWSKRNPTSANRSWWWIQRILVILLFTLWVIICFSRFWSANLDLLCFITQYWTKLDVRSTYLCFRILINQFLNTTEPT